LLSAVSLVTHLINMYHRLHLHTVPSTFTNSLPQHAFVPIHCTLLGHSLEI
jgi:hypothetical protein